MPGEHGPPGNAPIAPGAMVPMPVPPMPGEMLEPLDDPSKNEDDPGIDPTLPIDDDPGIVDPTLPIVDDPGIVDPTLPIEDVPTPGLPKIDVPAPGALPNMPPELPNEPGARLKSPPVMGAGPKPGLAPNVPIVPKGAAVCAKLRGEAATSAAAATDNMYLRSTMRVSFEWQK
jgi:hypothetical protein